MRAVNYDLSRLKTGVYAIVCLVNGKLYVGSAARSFRSRESEHWSLLRKGKHRYRLQADWRRYGEDQFRFVVLEFCSPEDCIEREQFYINLHHSYKFQFGYNISPTAASNRGCRHSLETRKKISAIRKGTKASEATKEKMRIARAGRTPNQGHSHSAEAKAKISQAQAGRARPPLSEETKGKISLAATGRRHTAEARAKMSASRMGKKRGSYKREAAQ